MASLARETIRKKRDGEALSESEIRELIAGITDRSVPDYQAAAMLMAIVWRGMTPQELAWWTDAMLRSGDVLDLSEIPAAKIDKHSTGGVGDKISLPLAPAVAACGVAVPMVSGRGLGHTGGTLDKLEAIPGFKVTLPVERFRALVGELGLCLIGQTDRIAPADRILYALRDVTATVESVPLIASSIMSKKLAEGIDGLVLDCKVGAGAFMKTLDGARELATTIVGIGRLAGKRVSAVLSNMDQPIGQMVGNALEIEETIAVLRGGGPADTRRLTVVLGGEMLRLGGVADETAEAERLIERALDDGRALDKFRRIVEAQGGDPRVCDEPTKILPQAPGRRVVAAKSAGYVMKIDAQGVGMAALVLGGGRATMTDVIDPAVGVRVVARLGDRVEVGDPLVELVHRDKNVGVAEERILAAYRVGAVQPDPQPLVHEVIR